MKRLLDAVVAYISADEQMQAFMGIGGPYTFMPEPTPALPFILITQIGGTPNWQGFSRTYVARAHLQITLWDRDAIEVQTNAEYVCSKLDVLGSLTLGGVELCRLPIRVEEPRFLPITSDVDGVAKFGCVLEYRFNVQRTRGVV